ncbi:MAG: YdcF family protein [Candidatus Saccharimonas sp.]
MKIVTSLLIIAVLFGFAAWSIGSYLGPDDLRHCANTQPSATSGCQTADVIVAISGGDTAARAAEAIALYQAGWAPRIIFSGAAADKSGPSNAQVMKQQAIDKGIDPNVIIIEEQSETTGENAAKTTSIFEKNNYKSAILVTSAYHQRRALLEFNRRALNVTVRSHPVPTDKQWGRFWWLTPTGWLLAIPEVVRSLILSTGGIAR